ncbi:hypothetical protein GEV33_000822 [Tenebrio molitor]|uniref:Uncharacterized protein n=1 Tax=Tenebrio molitor TaxID=7067 RepID=A0A8J6HW84_TENMO|nr:hypothetical protein GEV33_000822 [Tenebrio molitor]
MTGSATVMIPKRVFLSDLKKIASQVPQITNDLLEQLHAELIELFLFVRTMRFVFE